MAQWHPPAVVMVDIGLPDIDGYEVARRLRETIGARSQQAGFNAHVIKPVDPSKLAEVIRQPR